MKKIFQLIFCLFLAQLNAQTPGSLDNIFAVNGISTTDRSSFESNLAFVVQPDGKIIFVTEDENDFIKVIRVKTRP